MRVGFDASVVFSSVGGTRVYALQLLAALMDARPDWEYFLYTRDERQSNDLAERFKSTNTHFAVVRGAPNTWRLQANLPGRLRNDRVDLYHSLGYFLPLRWPGARVVTVHDLNVYLSWRSWMRPGKFVQWADMALQIPLVLKSADRIITVSKASSDAIVRTFHVSPAKISVIPNAPDPYFDEAPSEAELANAAELTGRAPFVLFVGILSPQKNLEALVRAFAEAQLAGEGYRLVLAGSDREGENASLRRVARDAGIEHALVLPGYVADSVLRALYRKAVCLVLPSLGEGFGLPLVEAMACGTPVIAAGTQALPEVVGDAGVLIDPRDVAGLAAVLRRVSHDGGFRDELVRKGRLRRAAFSWRAAAEATAAVYEDALSSRR